MLLQFITASDIGPKERKLIRAHVMKGKNLGRSRRQGRVFRETKPVADHPGVIAGKAESLPVAGNMNSGRTLGLIRLFWHDLSLTSFPRPIHSDSRKLVYQWLWVTAKVLYPPEFCSEVDLSHYPWYQYVLEDEAYFHCLLAVSASFEDRLHGKIAFSPRSLHHISRAYRLLNDRLSGPDALSDQALAVVTLLTIYSYMHRHQSHGLTHFAGLCTMIRYRGGLAALAKQNIALAQKPWRLSLEFALETGSMVAFSLTDMPDNGNLGIDTHSKPVPSSLPPSNKSRLGISLQLSGMLEDIQQLATILNSTSARTRLNPMHYSEAVFSRLHRLLHFAPLGTRRLLSAFDDLVHLSLVAVMTTLMPEYGRHPTSNDLLSNMYRCAISRYTACVVTDPKTLLWALFIASITVFHNDTQDWLCSIVSGLCSNMNLLTWDEVEAILSQLPWLRDLYSAPAAKLWAKARNGKDR
ncbi:hypothetical protein IQ07DRAFT_8669 [Pyrenochaeta sp. DS3sAY3a]|nr:hypothetical protein IQ07DRAFT_8669 [Pyrenochaeta sp. DS3sAY3a]